MSLSLSVDMNSLHGRPQSIALETVIVFSSLRIENAWAAGWTFFECHQESVWGGMRADSLVILREIAGVPPCLRWAWHSFLRTLSEGELMNKLGHSSKKHIVGGEVYCTDWTMIGAMSRIRLEDLRPNQPVICSSDDGLRLLALTISQPSYFWQLKKERSGFSRSWGRGCEGWRWEWERETKGPPHAHPRPHPSSRSIVLTRQQTSKRWVCCLHFSCP